MAGKKWDNKQSVAWVNGNPMPAPQCKYAEQKGNSELQMPDDGHEYRTPVVIF